MKICSLTISNYMQFKNLELDLTYPKGYKKEGQSLDKICIIGQSGTGKTNLLNIIKNSVMDFSKLEVNKYLPFSEFPKDTTKDSYITSKFITQNNILCETLFTKTTSKINSTQDIELLENEKKYFISADRVSFNLNYNNKNKQVEMSESDRVLLNEFNKHRQKVINNASNYSSISGFENSLKSIDEKIAIINKKYNSIEESVKELKSKNFIDRNIININDGSENSWELIRDRIENHKEEEKKYDSMLFNKIMSDTKYAEQAKKDKEKWLRENENILDTISSKVNSFLNQFNLELAKIDENHNSYNDLTVRDLSNGNIIKYDNLSTGTKNLLSTFIPLKIYNPKDSMILIDEPEISFYPNIQTQLTDLYTSIGSNNQLIVATHSPLIASSFEPWEVVELKFDENNQIYREQYFKEENHRNNYFLDPRYLTWTGILTDIFDLNEDSNFSVREKKLMEYATLKAEIKAMKNIEEKEKKFKELQKLSKKLGLYN